MSSPAFAFGQRVAGLGNSLADKWRTWQDQGRRAAAYLGQASRNYADQGGLTGMAFNSGIGAGEAFGAGFRGETMPGQDIPLPAEPYRPPVSLAPQPQKLAIEEYINSAMPVGEDGIPNLLRRPEGMAPEPVPAPSPGAGLSGQALRDALGYRDDSAIAGPRETRSAFGREYQVPISGGSFSQMNDNPNLHSLAQLQDDRALADARPAEGDSLGRTAGEVRAIEAALAARRGEAKIGTEAALEVARGQAGIRKEEQQALLQSLSEQASQEEAERQQLESDPRFLSLKPEDQAKARAVMEQRQATRRQRQIEGYALATGKVNTTFRGGGDPLAGG